MIAYVAAFGVGIGLVVNHEPFTVVDSAISWIIAACACDRPPAGPLYHVHRIPPGPDGVVRHRGDAGCDGGAGRHGVAPARGLARPARSRRRRRDGAGPARVPGRREQAAGAAREPRAGPGAGCVRVRRRGVGDLPRRGARTRARAEDDRRQGGLGARHGRLRRGRPDLRARAGRVSSIRRPASSTALGRLPTRSCGPSGAGSPGPSPWTSCSCSSPSRFARPWA